MVAGLTNSRASSNPSQKAQFPPNINTNSRDPNTRDYFNHTIGDLWINKGTTSAPLRRVWMLVDQAQNIATWVLLINGGGGPVISLTGNTGGAVFPLLGNINVVGDGTTINVAGNPGTHTLTISTVGTGVVSSFVTDNGTANPIAGVIDIFAQPQAGSSVTFSASTNVIRLNTSDVLDNTIIGNGAGNTLLSGNLNTGVGRTALLSLTSGSNNTALGWANLIALTTGSSNSALGSNSLTSLTTGSNNTAIGQAALSNVLGGLLTGSNNIAIGAGAGSFYNGAESNNIVIGNVGVNGESNKIKIGTFGSGVGQQNATTLFGGTVSIPNGNVSLPNTTATLGAYNINNNRFVHNYGTNNTFVGESSANFTLTGDSNVAIGTTAMGLATTASDNVFVGWGSGLHITTGENNVGIGSGALNGPVPPGTAGLTTGIHNVAIGHQAGSGYTGAESSNILIGSSVQGTAAESNVCRIGNGTGASDTQINECYIAGIRGITTNVNDAVAVLVDSADQLGTVSSSIRYKDNVKDMDDQSSVVYKLRPVTFNYKKFPEAPAWGLIAEEVEQVFPQLVVYKDDVPESVKYHDLVPLLLNEIQRLSKRIDELEKNL